MARRLIAAVAIPTLLAMALAGLRVSDAVRSAEAYGQVGQLATLGQQVTGLAQAMEDERADTATFIAAGRPASGLPALHRRYAVTGRWAARTRRLIPQLGPGYPAQTRAGVVAVLGSIAGLPGLRRQATQGNASALAVIGGYSAAIAGLFPVNDGIADLTGGSALTTSVRALGWLSRLKDQASKQQAILAVALAEGRFGPGALAALTIAEAQQASYLASFRSAATSEESWALTDTLARPLAAQARTIEQRATAAGNGPLALGPHAGQQWSAGTAYTVGWMRNAEQQLGAWITAYAQAQQRSATRSAMITGGAALAALILIVLVTLIMARSLVRPLRRLEAAALHVAGVRLPAEVRTLNVAGNSGPPLPVTLIDVPSAGEIGQVARAFDRVHEEAVRLAWEEARRQGSTNAIYASSFRRSHALLERLLRLIDGLELGEDHPERLATLFQIDHLATRLRRNSDSTLVLAGHDGPHRRTEPIALVDVLRAAVSEIEQYERVAVDAQAGISVSGSAAADAAHLLAELLDNATTFSPRAAQVTMSGHRVRGSGALITITDGGTGMPEEQLTQLNSQLAHPQLADVTDAPHLGLLAVARLAVRHGIEVVLRRSPGGGTTAEVRLPATLITSDAKPGGPGAAGKAFRPEAAGGAAAAADPRRPAPRFHAGPEVDTPPQNAVPAAVPLPLGAPLLPIFESVESHYFHNGQDRPGTGQPAAGQPAAGQPDGPRASGALTSAGLPQRIPRASLVPGSAAERPTRPATPAESAQIALGRLASFQRGSRRARAVSRIDRDAKQPSRDT